MLTGVVYAIAAAQLMMMIYVSSAHQATNTAEIDSASSLYLIMSAYTSLRLWKPRPLCSFAAKVQETGNVSLLTEASKLQARDADFGKNLQFSGGMEGNWEPDYQLVLVQRQETPSMEITEYNPSGCLACCVKPTCSLELSAVRSLTTASDQFKIFIIQEPREAHFPSGSIIPSRAKNNGFSQFSRREKSDKIFQNLLQRRDYVPGGQGAGWQVEARWWQGQQCRKRWTSAGTGAYEG